MKVFFEHAFKRTFRQKLLVSGMLVFPLAVAIAPHPVEEVPPIGFSLYGLIILFSGFLLTKQIIDDRTSGTITRIAAAPVRHIEYLSGHILAYLSVLAIQNLIFVVMARVMWQSLELSFILLFLVYLVFSALSITFSLFWHMLFRAYATSIALFSVLSNMVAIAGGLIVPIKLMPEAMKDVAIVLPTYWFAYSIQNAYDLDHAPVFLGLLIVAGFAILFLVIGSRRRLS
ncbi:MAG: ABC transporter permease [Bacillota bacterium]